jgi:hypothetical protein
VWDGDEEEEEGEEEDPADRLRRMNHQKKKWKEQTEEPVQRELDSWAENILAESSSAVPTNWMEYLMPPYSSKSKVPLPYSHQSQMIAHWDSYTTSHLQEWKEDDLSERLRHLLENSDACQGVCITTEGHGVYAGLASFLLQEFKDECKSAGRIVFHLNSSSSTRKPVVDDQSAELGWQPAHVERLRQHLCNGLALSDITQHSDAILPLRLGTDDNKSLFEASARLAMALESTTLPFRLNSNADPRYKIGLQNAPFFGQGGTDSRWGSTAQSLTIWEYLSCLKPQRQYSVLELDVVQNITTSNKELWNHFKVGTSIERDQRMRDMGRDATRNRPRDTSPGGWMQDVKHGGILSSLSLGDITDRSLHHHFGLSTSVRPILQSDLSQYLTCLVQGMGIRYRPERSMCTVLDQTIGNLTRSGYGAGAYWRSLVGKDVPVVSVLGNTTRVYPLLDQKSSKMKMVLGHRYRGYYNRDVMNGVLPEAEDCQEALENCFNVRDAYLPPEGSGLVEPEGDIDF